MRRERRRVPRRGRLSRRHRLAVTGQTPPGLPSRQRASASCCSSPGTCEPCVAPSGWVRCEVVGAILHSRRFLARRNPDARVRAGLSLSQRPHVALHRARVRVAGVAREREREVHDTRNGGRDAGRYAARAAAPAATPSPSSSSASLSASCTRRPVRMRNMVAPSAKTSTRPSISARRPSACSGAMYASVPSATPVRVRCSAGTPSSTRASPKSRILMRPVGGDEQIVRLEVAVDDALLVRRREHVEDLIGVVEHLARRGAVRGA